MERNQIIEEIMSFNKPDYSKLASLIDEMRDAGIPQQKLLEFEARIKTEVITRQLEKIKSAYDANFTSEQLLAILNFCKSNPEITSKMNKVSTEISGECAKDSMDFMVKFFDECEDL